MAPFALLESRKSPSFDLQVTSAFNEVDKKNYIVWADLMVEGRIRNTVLVQEI